MSMLAILYIFLGGVGGGALVMLCIVEGLRTLNSAPACVRAIPSWLLGRVWAVCFLLLALGIVCLSVDLGRFDGLLMLIISPRLTPIAVGAYCLAGSAVLSCAGAVCENFDRVSMGVVATRFFAVAGVCVGGVTIAYTGILLSIMASVAAWQSPMVPILFVLSSLSGGIALFVGCIASAEPHESFYAFLEIPLSIDRILICAEIVTLCVYGLWLAHDARCADALEALIVGDLAPLFWVVVCAMGLAIPLAMEWLAVDKSHCSLLVWVAAALLIGALALRFCIVSFAAYDPVQELASASISSGYSGLSMAM